MTPRPCRSTVHSARTFKLRLADTEGCNQPNGAFPYAVALDADRSTLGRLVETFVFQELRRQGSWHDEPVEFFHFRDRDGVEVDMVVERGTRVAGIEVKAASTVTNGDFAGLRKLRQATGKRFAAGVVLYDGESSASFGGGLYAVPIRAPWEPR